MLNSNKTLLWLDDVRDPFDEEIDWLVFSPIGKNVNIVWIKNYEEISLNETLYYTIVSDKNPIETFNRWFNI